MDRNSIMSGMIDSFGYYSDNYTVSNYLYENARVSAQVVEIGRAKSVFDSVASVATPSLLCACESYGNGKLFAITDFRTTNGAEKVFKFSGSASEAIRRADIKAEAVMFRYASGTTLGFVEDSKPLELEQDWDVLVFVEQGDSHSIKEARYSRLLAICDQLIDWSVQTSPSSISDDLYNITFSSTSQVDEDGGYLSATLTFTSQIKIQD